jgi:Cupin superfamily (DUF985)
MGRRALRSSVLFWWPSNVGGRLSIRNAGHWIEKLQLEPHPEGGYFRQTYRSEVEIAREALPAFAGGKNLEHRVFEWVLSAMA